MYKMGIRAPYIYFFSMVEKEVCKVFKVFYLKIKQASPVSFAMLVASFLLFFYSTIKKDLLAIFVTTFWLLKDYISFLSSGSVSVAHKQTSGTTLGASATSLPGLHLPALNVTGLSYVLCHISMTFAKTQGGTRHLQFS